MMAVVRAHIFLVVLLATHKVRHKTSFPRPFFSWKCGAARKEWIIESSPTYCPNGHSPSLPFVYVWGVLFGHPWWVSKCKPRTVGCKAAVTTRKKGWGLGK